MTIYHKDITETNLHENKGVSAASDNFVATATSGATVWKKLTTDHLSTSAFFRLNKFILQVDIADISTAEVTHIYIPVACTVNKVTSVIEAAINTADATLTAKNASGGSMGTITVANASSAAGDVDSLSPVSNNTFTAGQVMTVETDGGSTGTAKCRVTIELTQTA
jgi:YbbR domain-containing protein